MKMKTCIVMQEASDALSKTADSLSYALLKASSFLSVTNCTEET